MKFVAFERKEQGTSASRRLRRAGKVPGIVYGNGDALPIELDHNALWHAARKEAFHSSILDMEVDGKVTKVLLRDVQYHAYKPFITHIDFQRVNMKKPITLRVPVHYSGAEESPAVKIDGQMVNYIASELEIQCLPSQLPEFIAVDLSKLEKNGAMHVSDLTLPEGVNVVSHAEEDLTLVTASNIVEETVSDEAPAAPAADAAAPATPAAS
ncbi:50S ribosomal protein L25 [Saezia sanguinis]|uniref:Large ribosomal subunit protein bL25 n=1 Tax=Saezia sanguinis TaxID=1965230 RepID=A0A433SDL1_9BURK|nr:50S ribosomal protein L25/general stress protein Ctc [Saezia sanguinis]RUS66849.1 50S ribosomal protein L25 [Saezia sanguinis]